MIFMSYILALSVVLFLIYAGYRLAYYRYRYLIHLEDDALRWRALLASDRIRVLGRAGWKETEDYWHIGVDFYSTFPEDQDVGVEKGYGISYLTAYADHIREMKKN